VLAVLCVTEVTSWGVLYYALPVLALAIARDTGWPVAAVTGAFSAGLVVSALAGIPVGRLLDRIGPRPVMTAGSVLAVPAVVVIATAGTYPVFVAGWLLAGVAMSGTLYPPAFAALTRWWGPRRVQALTGLTLMAGLASTIFAPLTAALLGGLGWRGAYLVLAAVLAVVTIPAHALGLRGPWPRADHDGPARGNVGGVPTSRPFLLLAATITAGAFTAFAVVVNQVPLLIERGLSTTAAAWALGLGGVGQVLGRLGYRRLTDGLAVRARTVVILALTAVTTGVLAVLPGPAVLLVVAVMVTGSARGVFTLLQATAVTDRWGATHYGRLSGVLSAPALVATALAPWAGSALAAVLGGYPALFALLAAVATAGAALALGSVPRPSGHHGAGRPAPAVGEDVTGPARDTVALPRGPTPMTAERPSVLFVCVHNAGRSQMAAALLQHHAGDAVEVRSAGSAPADEINPAVREVMAELDIDLDGAHPKLLTVDAVQASDVVITMGCGDACPVFPGKRYLDWDLDDPAGQGADAVRPIRDEIDRRIRGLLAELGVGV